MRKEFLNWKKRYEDALGSYNKTTKIILFMKYYNGDTYRKISNVTGISRGTLYAFFKKFKSVDNWACLRAKNRFEIY